MNKRILSILILIAISSNLFAQGHTIEINISNLKNQELILGHYFSKGDMMIPDDTITLNNQGYGKFTGKSTYPGGMYFIFLANGKKIDFLLDNDQTFSLTADSSFLSNTVSIKGSKENSIFIELKISMDNIALEQEKLKQLRVENKGNKEKINEIDNKFKELNKNRNDQIDKIISENPDMFFSKFLKATRRVEVPKNITDRRAQYFYFRMHYFDPFDVSDPRLLRTPIYQATIDMFVDKVISQHHDTLIMEANNLIEKSRTNDELFRYMLVHLFKKYSTSQLMTAENVFVHIAEKYYIKEATWSDPKYISELKKRITNKKKCLIGNKAFDIDFRTIPNDTNLINSYIDKNEKLKDEGLAVEKSASDSIIKNNLKIELLKDYFTGFNQISSLYSNTADYTIIWFWTPDCSHCRKDTPKFYDLYLEKNLDKHNVEVIGMFLQKDIDKWEKFAENNSDWLSFIKEHKLTKWKHAWNPFDLFRRNFDIGSSPIVYVLDKNKTIVAKKISYEQAIDVVEGHIKGKF